MEHINIAVAILSLCRLQSDVHILLHQNVTLPHFVMKRHHAPPLQIGDVITFDVQCVYSSSLQWRSQGDRGRGAPWRPCLNVRRPPLAPMPNITAPLVSCLRASVLDALF